MQIVIDMPENLYKTICENEYGVHQGRIYEIIRNGTPLPKGHGRLIDADALNTRMKQRMDRIGDDESIWEASNVKTALDILAPTIIEADEGSEVKNDKNNM